MITNPAELFDVTGKVVLVTGGANGLGRMISEGFVRAGADVTITSRNPDSAGDAAEAMREFGSCTAIAADLSSPDGCGELAARLADARQQLDVRVNNAGRTWGGAFETFPDKAWGSVMSVNVQTPFTLARDLFGPLKESATAESPARIINIGSAAGITVERLSAYSYSASKAAILQLSRELAAELAPHHITVNTVVPGYFPTQMTSHIREDKEKAEKLIGRIPLDRLGTAEDIVGACIMLSSRAGAYMTGTALTVDGGLTGCR